MFQLIIISTLLTRTMFLTTELFLHRILSALSGGDNNDDNADDEDDDVAGDGEGQPKVKKRKKSYKVLCN